MSQVLQWDYLPLGRWDAASCIHSDGSFFTYCITINEDGRFDVDASDEIHMPQHEPFASLLMAKRFCERNEQQIRESVRNQGLHGNNRRA
jgi:hypothetical protein